MSIESRLLEHDKKLPFSWLDLADLPEDGKKEVGRSESERERRRELQRKRRERRRKEKSDLMDWYSSLF